MIRASRMRKWLFPALVTLAVLAAANNCQAQGRRGLFFRARPFTHRPAPSYQETYQYLNWRYPKYVGGLHASYFRDLGLPPGDVGLRGNGLYMTPW